MSSENQHVSWFKDISIVVFNNETKLLKYVIKNTMFYSACNI